MTPLPIHVLAIDVGNSRIGACVSDGDCARETAYAPASDIPAAADMIVQLACELDNALFDDGRDARPTDARPTNAGSTSSSAVAVVASVNDSAARSLIAAVAPRLDFDLVRLGHDLPIPLEHALGAGHTTGQDRFLNALAAYEIAQQACVVIDAGTAITVDFIDGAGVFQGGAIAPGARMQLRSLHQHTAALPEVDLAWPDAGQAFAKTTAQAMLQGVCLGARGMVRALVERYAERYGAYPTVLATGGDAELLFHEDEFVEFIVADLTLKGVLIAARRALLGQPADGGAALRAVSGLNA